MERITQILPHVDLLVGNEQEIAMLAGREIPLIELDDYDKYIDKCYQSAVIVQEQYHIDTIAASLRKQKSASETSWSGMVLCGEEILINSRYEIKVEEVIGCGDAFVAGLLHSLLKGKSIQDAIGFAVSASCLKHTIEGDFNLVKEYEVEQLMDNYVYGIVKR
jgi:2-dehydro-3-deoxygluconokinase